MRRSMPDEAAAPDRVQCNKIEDDAFMTCRHLFTRRDASVLDPQDGKFTTRANKPDKLWRPQKGSHVRSGSAMSQIASAAGRQKYHRAYGQSRARRRHSPGLPRDVERLPVSSRLADRGIFFQLAPELARRCGCDDGSCFSLFSSRRGFPEVPEPGHSHRDQPIPS
jgi:hypothetical protein